LPTFQPLRFTLVVSLRFTVVLTASFSTHTSRLHVLPSISGWVSLRVWFPWFLPHVWFTATLPLITLPRCPLRFSPSPLHCDLYGWDAFYAHGFLLRFTRTHTHWTRSHHVSVRFVSRVHTPPYRTFAVPRLGLRTCTLPVHTCVRLLVRSPFTSRARVLSSHVLTTVSLHCVGVYARFTHGLPHTTTYTHHTASRSPLYALWFVLRFHLPAGLPHTWFYGSATRFARFAHTYTRISARSPFALAYAFLCCLHNVLRYFVLVWCRYYAGWFISHHTSSPSCCAPSYCLAILRAALALLRARLPRYAHSAAAARRASFAAHLLPRAVTHLLRSSPPLIFSHTHTVGHCRFACCLFHRVCTCCLAGDAPTRAHTRVHTTHTARTATPLQYLFTLVCIRCLPRTPSLRVQHISSAFALPRVHGCALPLCHRAKVLTVSRFGYAYSPALVLFFSRVIFFGFPHRTRARLVGYRSYHAHRFAVSSVPRTVRFSFTLRTHYRSRVRFLGVLELRLQFYTHACSTLSVLTHATFTVHVHMVFFATPAFLTFYCTVAFWTHGLPPHVLRLTFHYCALDTTLHTVCTVTFTLFTDTHCTHQFAPRFGFCHHRAFLPPYAPPAHDALRTTFHVWFFLFRTRGYLRGLRVGYYVLTSFVGCHTFCTQFATLLPLPHARTRIRAFVYHYHHQTFPWLPPLASRLVLQFLPVTFPWFSCLTRFTTGCCSRSTRLPPFTVPTFTTHFTLYGFALDVCLYIYRIFSHTYHPAHVTTHTVCVWFLRFHLARLRTPVPDLPLLSALHTCGCLLSYGRLLLQHTGFTRTGISPVYLAHRLRWVYPHVSSLFWTLSTIFGWVVLHSLRHRDYPTHPHTTGHSSRFPPVTTPPRTTPVGYGLDVTTHFLPHTPRTYRVLPGLVSYRFYTTLHTAHGYLLLPRTTHTRTVHTSRSGYTAFAHGRLHTHHTTFSHRRACCLDPNTPAVSVTLHSRFATLPVTPRAHLSHTVLPTTLPSRFTAHTHRPRLLHR